jgi:anti-sigma factor RsiW
MSTHYSDTQSSSDSEFGPVLDLEIQAYVDGELDLSSQQAFERRMSEDPSLHAAVERLQAWVLQIRSHPPEHRVDVHREFYFATIERRIEASSVSSETERNRRPTSPVTKGDAEGGWWKWFAPGFAMVALVVLISVLVQLPKQTPASMGLQTVGLDNYGLGGGLATDFGAGMSTDGLVAMSSWTYYSDADDLTLHWIN